MIENEKIVKKKHQLSRGNAIIVEIERRFCRCECGLARKSPVTAVELVNGRLSFENALVRIKKQAPS